MNYNGIIIQLVVWLCACAGVVRGAETLLGCYSLIPSSYVSSYYQYQSSSHCGTTCASYAYFALYNGGTCYCGNSAPSGSKSSSCNVACFGYGSEMCGGEDSYSFYSTGNTPSDSDSSDSSAASGTTAATTSSTNTNTATTTSTSSNTNTNTNSGTTTSATNTDTTSQDTAATTSQDTTATTSQAKESTTVTSTSVNKATTIIVLSTIAVSATPTITAVTTSVETTVVSSSSGATSATSSPVNKDKSNKSSNVGPIVGGVVGGVVFIVLVVLLILFLKRRNSQQKDAELADSEYFNALKRDGSVTFNSRPLSNPFLTKDEEMKMTDQRLNPVMLSRRRVSEGSLADDADYSRKILRVANPDDE